MLSDSTLCFVKRQRAAWRYKLLRGSTRFFLTAQNVSCKHTNINESTRCLLEVDLNRRGSSRGYNVIPESARCSVTVEYDSYKFEMFLVNKGSSSRRILLKVQASLLEERCCCRRHVMCIQSSWRFLKVDDACEKYMGLVESTTYFLEVFAVCW